MSSGDSGYVTFYLSLFSKGLGTSTSPGTSPGTGNHYPAAPTGTSTDYSCLHLGDNISRLYTVGLGATMFTHYF